MDKWIPALKVTGIGFYIATCIVGGTFLGHWLDGKLNTGHWLLLGGLVVGLIIAVYGVYRMIKPLVNEKYDKEND
jgi:F0F1-type ATP synthase assembly protein I